MNTTTWHNIKMITLIVLTFLVTLFQAIHGLASWTLYTDGLIPLLLMAEHGLNGNTGANSTTVATTTTETTTTPVVDETTTPTV